MDLKCIVKFAGILATLICCTQGNFTLTILHTNDVHARIAETDKWGRSCSSSDCYGGVARRHALVEKLRQEVPNVLFLDAGDQFQGTPWFNYYKGNATRYFMNKLKYDAMV